MIVQANAVGARSKPEESVFRSSSRVARALLRHTTRL
jgi:hypothetical protein